MQLDLADLYLGPDQAELQPGRCTYRLRSMVCAGGGAGAAGGAALPHCAFVLLPEVKRWVLYEPGRVSNVGRWDDVRRRCELSQLRPLMLFWEECPPL